MEKNGRYTVVSCTYGKVVPEYQKQHGKTYPTEQACRLCCCHIEEVSTRK